jgi:hypothetical protein
MFWIILPLFSFILGWFLSKQHEEDRLSFRLKEARVGGFLTGKRHGIFVSHLQAKQTMKELKKFIAVKYPYRSNEHDREITSVIFRHPYDKAIYEICNLTEYQGVTNLIHKSDKEK